MCGIAALYARDGEIGPVEAAMATMLARMWQRGPDNAGWRGWQRAALGSVRLRIQDLSAAADQPMSGAAGRAHIAFNGEIFNHRTLRRDLGPPPGGWRTHGDTETVIAGYERHGAGIVEALEGQFALAIFDEARGIMVLARDRFGICPLYVAEVGRLVVVASSVRAILAAFAGRFGRVDPAALQQFLLLRYVLSPRTLVDGIRQIGPGEVAVIDGGTTRHERYWRFGEGPAPEVAADGAVPELAAALERAVADNCSADAGVGVFLSGGIDSGIVASLARPALPLRPVASTISFGGADDEAAAAADLAARLGYAHVSAVAEMGDGTGAVDAAVAALDVPCGARDAVAAHVLAGALRNAAPAAKVVLTGTGADELFGGYRGAYFGPEPGPLPMQMARYLTLYSALAAEERPALRALVPAIDEGAIVDDLIARACAMLPSLGAHDPGRVLDLFYLVAHLPGWELSIADTMCMDRSLEARVPFLHTAVATVAIRVPSAPGAVPGQEKMALRRTARRWLAAEACARPKLPLSRPVAMWLERCRSQLAWRPAVLADIGIDAGALARLLAGTPSFDVWWRLFVLDRWVARHLRG
ncbi:asparagine synthase (glutamine-hydrolyzing) [Blastochloris viridis]|uniref:asparagine synthase (glutamine-hydrolyzing) n=1 Tax=Blastochloris viridis TaxID=1079 RepID=A0A0H5BP13_BLAVI|nr:asparagine synthase (glutamine-hydrolyzing) [Blastochloris viridis]ALK08146.1 Asparagine synthetase [glutamine-hydrolyzing] 1 [Blastochloris viridis]BAR98588.1 asparagine synthetase [glutamine-hydrolyzing] [Blastochloris viridis]CUU44068.1 Asparagine synthetase [glutamine-hydrolyzing] 1 [Blastochloris viridis]